MLFYPFHRGGESLNLAVFGGCHAVGIAEKARKSGTAGNAGEFADNSYGFVGGLQQTSDVLQTVAVNKVTYGFTV